MEVKLHVDVRMRQKARTQTTKIKSFVEVYSRKLIPSKYTHYIRYAKAFDKVPHSTLIHKLVADLRISFGG